MGTQNTGKNTPTPPGTLNADGTREIHGRRLKHLTPQQLQEEAARVADETGAANFLQPGVQPPAPEDKEAVNRMIPEYLKEMEQKEQEEEEEGSSSVDRMDVVGLLHDEIMAAKQSGDTAAAERMQQAIDRATNKGTFKRIRKAKPEHPVLQKIKANLGVAKIKPVEIAWGGVDWLFYPTHAQLDAWVVMLMDTHNYAALKVCASLVGMDGAPIYEILNIPMEGKYAVDGNELDGVNTTFYEKTCGACDAPVAMAAERCMECGANLDPYDMPIDLRVRCANDMHLWLLKNFGPYEELHQLFDLMRLELPDRIKNREELYGPFIKFSQKQSKKTTDSESGGTSASD